jgi:hypothetical protein
LENQKLWPGEKILDAKECHSGRDSNKQRGLDKDRETRRAHQFLLPTTGFFAQNCHQTEEISSHSLTSATFADALAAVKASQHQALVLNEKDSLSIAYGNNTIAGHAPARKS